MPSSNPSQALVQVLRMIPPKWALGILVAVIGYGFFQPVVNRNFGWHLPSLAHLVNGQPEEFKRPERPDESDDPTPATQVSPPKVLPTSKAPPTSNASSTNPPSNTPSKSATTAAPTQRDTADLAARVGVTGSDLKFGFLKEIGRERYQSPAGLIYTRGSEEGHRLKHIQRHTQDAPGRPGPHGVFEAEMPQVLRWIDEAFQKASKGDRMAKKRQEDDSTIYEFTFDKPIGFIGGSEGKQRKNPSTKRIRIVVIDRNVITAFPF